MRRKDAYDRDALHFAPFVLFPSPFPRSISTPNATLKSSEAVNQPTHPPLHPGLTPSTFPFQDIFHFAFDLFSPASSQHRAPTIHNLQQFIPAFLVLFPPNIKIPRRLARKSE